MHYSFTIIEKMSKLTLFLKLPIPVFIIFYLTLSYKSGTDKGYYHSWHENLGVFNEIKYLNRVNHFAPSKKLEREAIVRIFILKI